MTRTRSHAQRRARRSDAHWKTGLATAWFRRPSLSQTWAMVRSSIWNTFREIGFLSYKQRNFLDEYGPAVWEWLLAFPGIRSMRRLHRKVSSSTYDRNAKTLLVDLPDELLSMIITHLLPACQHRACSKTSLRCGDVASVSKVSRRTRDVMAPILYRDVAIMHGWSRASRALTTLSNLPDIYPHVWTFRLSIHTWPGTTWMPATHLTPRLSEMLPAFTRLRTLYMQVPAKHARNFGAELAQTSFSLPSVQNLVLGPDLESMIGHCPNVKSVASTGRSSTPSFEDHAKYYRSHTLALIQSAGCAEALIHFELDADWECRHLDNVYQAMPNLRKLSMVGRLAWEEPRDIFQVLMCFKNLQDLVLPPISKLNVGFYQQGMCGNSFLGPGGRERLEQENQRRAKASRDAAKPVAELVFRRLVQLERLWIGDTMLYTHTSRGNETIETIEFQYEGRPDPAGLEDERL